MKKRLHFFNEKVKQIFVLSLILSLAFVSFTGAQTKVTGTLIGTDGSWNNNSATTKEAAVDEDINTFFDGPTSQSWLGYDYGSQIVFLTSIKFFPRNSNTTSLPDRMAGNAVYGSNIGGHNVNPSDKVLLFTFPPADTGSHLEGEYDYRAVAAGTTLAEFTLDPAPTEGYKYIYMTSYSSCNVGEIEFWGTANTLGLDDLSIKKNELKIFPNPSTNNSFSIKLAKGYNNSISSVKIYSILGNLVLDKAVNTNTNEITINHNLKSGVYIVKLDDSTSKLIVK